MRTVVEEAKLTICLLHSHLQWCLDPVFLLDLCGGCPYYFWYSWVSKTKDAWCSGLLMLVTPLLGQRWLRKQRSKIQCFFRTKVLPKAFCAWNLCQEGGIVWLQNINMCCSWLKRFVGHRQTSTQIAATAPSTLPKKKAFWHLNSFNPGQSIHFCWKKICILSLTSNKNNHFKKNRANRDVLLGGNVLLETLPPWKVDAMRPWNLASLTLPAFILHGCGDGSSTTSTTVAEATTTTSSAEFGQCFPDSSIDYDNSNYLCYAASYCSEQDSAIKLGPMTLAECTLVKMEAL